MHRSVIWALFTVFLILPSATDAGYCYSTAARYSVGYRREYYSVSCGWWSSCSRSRVVSFRTLHYYTIRECCNGYSGHGCSSPICTTACRNGGRCTAPNTCSCVSSGYASPYCDDLNECSSNNGGCSHTCENTIGSYRCVCPAGFVHRTPNGHECEDVDECRINNGDCSDICNNFDGSYSCSCRSGYVLDSDGKTCKDVDECIDDKGGCRSHCINTAGSYECSCDVGYQLDFDLHTCNDEDECIMTYNGGCEGICINEPGSFTCECPAGSQLAADGSTCEGLIVGSTTTTLTVFQRHNIVRKLLPRGCSTTPVLACNAGNDFDVLLSSTSPWFQLKSDTGILYTSGIVFFEIDPFSLPISIDGCTVSSNSQGYSVTNGPPQFSDSDGIQQSTISGTPGCLSVDFTISDIHEFIESLSFLNSFFDNLDQILPDWLSFSMTNNELFSYSNLDTKLLNGDTIDAMEWCRGAPVKSNHLYHVLQFGEYIKMSVYGDSITLPKPSDGEKLCFIIDICEDRATTFFLMLPETVGNFLSEVKLFQTLTENNDIQLLVRGFGISINRNIDVHYHRKSVTFWNGDHTFLYPVFEEANIWLGTDYRFKFGFLEITGNSDIFIGVPSIQNILIATFKEEWNLFFDISAVADLRLTFELFGEMCEIVFGEVASTDIDFYASIGGLEERNFCGIDANPSGVFFAINLKVNPFRSIPLLQDWIFDLDTGAHVFVVKNVDTDLSILNVDVTPILIEISAMVERVVTMISDFLVSQYELLTQFSINLLNHLSQSFSNLSDDLQALIELHKLPNIEWSMIANAFKDVWSVAFTVVKRDVQGVIDSLEFNVKAFHKNLTDSLKTHIVLIEERIEEYIEQVTSLYTNAFKQPDGFGIRAYVDIMIFTLKIPKVTIEFVYSVDSLAICSKYKELYKLFEGVESARVLGMISTDVRLGRFLRMSKDYGLGAALSIKSPFRFLIQIHAGISLLGVTSTCDLFISNNGIYTIYEINVWNTFLAQLTVSAEIGRSWYDLTFSVIGKFLADSNNDGSFEDSYMDALRKVVNDIGNAAINRLTQAQAGLSTAQNAFTNAQSWLERKKTSLRNANKYFDNAVNSLEKAKQKLEAAKEPFRRALERLRQAQRDVAKLCRIRSCRYFCIPGLRLKWCRGWWGIRYPCLRFTSCMFRVPDPICVAQNAFCYMLRAIAYTALYIAQIFVRSAMLVMDAAKAAVSVAQFVVDKSRVVLDVAIALVDVAQLGLEAAKGVLEIAKAALEGVKVLVRIGLKVFDLIVRIGLQSVIDVKNCQFEARIKTTDLPVLSVECEINLFRLGWNKIKLEVNFRRILQSLWQVAKEFIDSIISSIVDVFGRKRRDIEHMAKHFTNKILRETRDTDGLEVIDAIINETILSSNKSSDDYSYRVQSFRDRCILYRNVYSFLTDSVIGLLEMTNETASVLKENGTNSQTDITNTDELTNNMTLDDMGVDLDVARDEYNITTEDLDSLMANFTDNVANDSLIQEISKLSNESKNINDEQIEMSDNSNMIEVWIQVMENSTRQFFDNETCSSFIDCVHHSVSVLYDIFYGEDSVNTTLVYGIVSEIENHYLQLFGNETTPILNINAAAEHIIEEMSALNDNCPFCYTAPVLSSPFANLSVLSGENAYFMCDVTGDPEPTLWWFRDDEHLENETNRLLAVKNVTETMGPYRCVAGNVVANLTTTEVYVNIQEQGQKPTESDVKLTTILATTLSVVGVIAIALAIVLIRIFLRKRASASNGFGSFATLNMIRPTSALSQGKTDSWVRPTSALSQGKTDQWVRPTSALSQGKTDLRMITVSEIEKY